MENIELLHLVDNLLKENFADRINTIILFGSRVDGTAHEYSDYDLLIVTNESVDWETEDTIRELLYTINIQHDVVLSIQFISENELSTIKGKQPFIQRAIETGISLR